MKLIIEYKWTETEIEKKNFIVYVLVYEKIKIKYLQSYKWFSNSIFLKI